MRNEGTFCNWIPVNADKAHLHLHISSIDPTSFAQICDSPSFLQVYVCSPCILCSCEQNWHGAFPKTLAQGTGLQTPGQSSHQGSRLGVVAEMGFLGPGVVGPLLRPQWKTADGASFDTIWGNRLCVFLLCPAKRPRDCDGYSGQLT